jgi:GNAT superfamily N-acetyltransferase
MREIRTISAFETDAFLRILCDVFSLDFARAAGVFKREPFYSLDRKWALFVNGAMASILTTVPVRFADGGAIGIAGVATLPAWRGQGFAGDLLRETLRVAEQNGEGRALLFARDNRMYEREGFVAIDEAFSTFLPRGIDVGDKRALEQGEVIRLYDAWSRSEPRALLRDATRWDFWAWTNRSAHRLNKGYYTVETGRVKEMLPEYASLPTGESLEWYGIKSVAEYLRIPISAPRPDTVLMAKNFGFKPLIFMTDQF